MDNDQIIAIETRRGKRRIKKPEPGKLQGEPATRFAAAEAAAAAALAMLQHWTAWGTLEAMRIACEAQSAQHAELIAELAGEVMQDTDGCKQAWNAWETMDTAVRTWADVAGIEKRKPPA
jgi:hypothetical protein